MTIYLCFSYFVLQPNKPLVERKRRERINQSLDQMKELVLQSLNKNTAEYSKMEKADILEMTVGFLRDFQRQQCVRQSASSTQNRETVASNYQAGYSECLSEVGRYLQSSRTVNPNTKLHLLDHLATNVSPRQHNTSPVPVVVAPVATSPSSLSCPSASPCSSRTPSPASSYTSSTSYNTPSPVLKTESYSPQYTVYGQVSPSAVDFSQTGAIISQSYRQAAVQHKMPVRHQKVWRPW